MTATALTVAYDGAPFVGWAPQPGRRTVAGALSEALAVVLRGPVPLVVAGRTDTGVHALGQVVSHPGPPPRLRGVNALLPSSVSVLRADEVPDGFSARHDAVARSYLYRVLVRQAPSPFDVGRALHWPYGCSVDALVACAGALVGEHDFTAFTPAETVHRRFSRVVSAASWAWAPGREGELLEFRVTADAFLRSMNRVLVGTMLEVAGGRRSVESFAALLSGAPRTEAGPTAPPHGLYLESVSYREGWLNPDKWVPPADDCW